jgi:hypothetical protein
MLELLSFNRMGASYSGFLSSTLKMDIWEKFFLGPEPLETGGICRILPLVGCFFSGVGCRLTRR